MKLLPLILAATMVAPLAPVQAKNFNNPSTGHCPPGLAKKNWHCMPPGLVKQDYYRGGFLPIRDYDYILNPFDYGLPRLRRGEGYVQIGESFIRVNRETYEIINLFDAIGRVLD